MMIFIIVIGGRATGRGTNVFFFFFDYFFFLNIAVGLS